MFTQTREPAPPAEEVTALLVAAREGDESAQSRLFAAVYDELRRIARRHMRGERSGITLQTTALVHEAYLRLAAPGVELGIRDRTHFLAVASRAMRRILVDHARARRTEKRGGEAARVTLEEALPAAPSAVPADELLALDRALDCLQDHSPHLSRLVELHFFGGLSFAEVAAAREVSLSTIKREWRRARAFIYGELTGEPAADAAP